MTILCIETSTQVCSAALTIGGVPVAERVCREGANHARMLPVFVDELLSDMRQRGLRLEAVALSEGPGSYTGLRIGTSLAKGLCYGLSIPLLPVPTLQVVSASAAARGLVPSSAVLCPMIDARRMEVYTCLYDADLRPLTAVESRVVEGCDWLPSDADVYYMGDGAAKCQPVLSAHNLHFVPDVVPEAGYMGLLAEQLLSEGFSGADVAYYEPFYLKAFVAAPSHVKGLK